MCSGRPTVRRAEVLSGGRMTQQAKAGTPKGTGKTDTGDRDLRVVVSDNRPDTNPSWFGSKER
jgi:hypothetical protein